MQYLNLGCGQRFHADWTNIDFQSTGQGVIAHNLSKGIPFPDNSFDCVYHSHVLEHFPKSQAEKFLSECYRVLKPQGIIRVVVPDLEQIARLYLYNLEQALSGSLESADNYDWILLEMYDQVARNISGGEMKAYLFQKHIPNEEFLVKRCGSEVKQIIQMGKNQEKIEIQVSILQRVKTNIKKPIINLLKTILGYNYQALQIGKFRLSGEVHQWMYDRYSLSLLLKKCGFAAIIQRTAYESYLPQWTSFNLDTEADNHIYKPDSLYMEAIKPITIPGNLSP